MLVPFYAASLAAPPPACRADRIAISLGGQNGEFDGMSHSGMLVILRNRSRRACSLPALPAMIMRDAQGRALPIARQTSIGLHPGPALRPVRVAARGMVSTALRWVSGEVYNRSRCFSPAAIAVVIGGGPGVAISGTTSAPITAHICGQANAPVTFTQPPLRPGVSTSG